MKIALVTPCRNKAPFVEATIRSVLDQNDPDLEYGIVDGASTDGTQAVLEKYRSQLAFLLSEPDRGMYDALNKGFARTQGDIMGYLGADDLHMPWTLSVVKGIFRRFPEIDWLTSLYPLTADGQGHVLKARRLVPPCAAAFFRGANLPGQGWWAQGWIQQESTFWRRALWERAGGLDADLKLAGDFDLWCRFMKLAEPAAVATPLAAFRRHGDQITGTQAAAYGREARESWHRHGGRSEGAMRSRLREALRRLGFGRGGAVVSHDFARQDWRLDRMPTPCA